MNLKITRRFLAILFMAGLGVGIGFWSGVGQADETSPFIETLIYDILRMDDAIHTVDGGEAVLDGSGADDGYFLMRFWLRLRPRVERDLPGFGKIAVVPEVQMLWQQAPPAGWEVFKPK